MTIRRTHRLMIAALACAWAASPIALYDAVFAQVEMEARAAETPFGDDPIQFPTASGLDAVADTESSEMVEAKQNTSH